MGSSMVTFLFLMDGVEKPSYLEDLIIFFPLEELIPYRRCNLLGARLIRSDHTLKSCQESISIELYSICINKVDQILVLRS